MKLIWMAAGVALATATAATASSDGGKATEEAPTEKVVCKTEKVTGSRTKTRRTCMTQREWDQVAAASRKGVDDISRQSGRNPSDGSSRPAGMAGGL